MNIMECVLYANKLIAVINETNLFSEQESLFLDDIVFFDEILKKSEENFKHNGNPEITDVELIECANITIKKTFQDTFSGLIEKGVINPVSVDDDGSLLYGINPNFLSPDDDRE